MQLREEAHTLGNVNKKAVREGQGKRIQLAMIALVAE